MRDLTEPNQCYSWHFENQEERASWILEFLKREEVNRIEISFADSEMQVILATPKKKFICNESNSSGVKILTEEEVKEIFISKRIVVCAFAINPEENRNVFISTEKNNSKIAIETFSEHTKKKIEQIIWAKE